MVFEIWRPSVDIDYKHKHYVKMQTHTNRQGQVGGYSKAYCSLNALSYVTDNGRRAKLYVTIAWPLTVWPFDMNYYTAHTETVGLTLLLVFFNERDKVFSFLSDVRPIFNGQSTNTDRHARKKYDEWCLLFGGKDRRFWNIVVTFHPGWSWHRRSSYFSCCFVIRNILLPRGLLQK